MCLSVNRFRCQLAIQEVNYNQIDTDIYPSHHHGLPQYVHTQSVHSSRKNLNFEFAVDFDSELTTKSIATNTDDEIVIDMEELPLKLRQRSDSAHGRLQRSSEYVQGVLQPNEHDGGHGHDSAHGHISTHGHDNAHGHVRSCELRLREVLAQEMKENHELFDTVEHCLHVSNQMESMLAYYYQEEGQKDCFKFEEIYALRETDETVPFGGLSKHTETMETLAMATESGERSLSLGEFIKQTPHVETDLEQFFEDKSSIISQEKETEHVQDRDYDLL